MLFPPAVLLLVAALPRGAGLDDDPGPLPPPPPFIPSRSSLPAPTPTAADAVDAGVAFEGSHGGGAEKKLVSVSGYSWNV